MGRKKLPVVVDPEKAITGTTDHRNAEMFRRWMKGESHEQLAKAFGLHPATVGAIAVQGGWSKLRKKFNERLYDEMLDTMHEQAVDLMGALHKDYALLVSEHQGKKKKSQFSKEERQHMVKLFELMLNEAKLRAGQPTAISKSETSMKFILPVGAKSPFIIPPAPGVTVEYQKPEDIKKDLISDAEFEEMVETAKERKS